MLTEEILSMKEKEIKKSLPMTLRTPKYSCFPNILWITINVIIIYLPYTCLCVCYKRMLCLMYDFCQKVLYLVTLSKNMDCFADLLYQF